ncbi:FabG-like 3-oxoacyl-(acyl-carrier-protein) reductase [Baekduia alba]|uniref:SDR family NAD(P)-dependent oxidoreductase n=1 Tax=Baekduia alba TaxID=2997333 RepID=UPI0023414159|nr:SDR family oxidoreductase [Baekduia alba]WCB93180.1 FabG-like 3-oxoacyl-(acyl-carrier-protein) reductase [Baekduia alba]
MALPAPSSTTAAVVTGASSGIGADLARDLAGRGHNVVLVARRADRLEALAAELVEAHGVRAEAVACDLIDPEAVRALPGRIEALGLTVDILVNNAGYGSAGQFVDLDARSESDMVRLNCETVVALTGHYAPAFVERRTGAILVVASEAGMQPIPGQATYGATKAFALSFAEALHTEVSHLGVAVTALCPGPVATEFASRAGMEDAFGQVPAFARVASPDCARAGIDGLVKNKRVVVPGLAIRAVGVAGRHTPRAVLLPLMKRFYPV